jgi:hypothetical protein
MLLVKRQRSVFLPALQAALVPFSSGLPLALELPFRAPPLPSHQVVG